MVVKSQEAVAKVHHKLAVRQLPSVINRYTPIKQF
jgi:hypothetical protein